MKSAGLAMQSLFAIFLLNVSITAAESGELRHTFRFDPEKLSVDTLSGYRRIRYPVLDLSQTVGAPELPVKIARFALPPGSRFVGVSVTATRSRTLDGEALPYPAQPPHLLSGAPRPFAEPDAAIYTGTSPFPESPVQRLEPGRIGNVELAAVQLFPVQYDPAGKRLIFHTEIEVTIEYAEYAQSRRAQPVSAYAERIHRKSLSALVENPDAIPAQTTRTRRDLPTETHAYVIITSDGLKARFEPLAAWKRRKGLSARIVTTSWIDANYPGVDGAERMRNFLKDAWRNWSTVWVLLGGDTNVVPHRKAFAMDCEYGPYSDNYIPSDLYFSDLDGDWNANGNDIFGEIDDNVEMYPDLFVGRAPVENAAEADAFVAKVLAYEKNPPADYARRMLFLAEILWHDPYTNSGEGKDHIDREFVPPRFDPITKLYEHDGNQSAASAVAAMNEGYHIINHDGHANITVMGMGNGYVYSGTMAGLTNGDRQSILYSIGCWPAAFDHDCIAENFVTNPDGGGVAFIGNSRYGWGSPGNPLFGYSDRFDQAFFKTLFVDEVLHLGQALATAKSVFVPLAGQENVYRWCEYEINLLGDPEMPVWTDTPKPLDVEFQRTISTGDTTLRVTVTDNGAPVSNAMICNMNRAMQGDSVYVSATTGADGTALLPVSTTDPTGPLLLTATAQNFIPFEGEIDVTSDAAHVGVTAFLVDDGAGDAAEGLITPGRSAFVDVSVKNFGNAPVSNVSVTVTSPTADLVVTDGNADFADLTPGQTRSVANAFTLQADGMLQNGEVIHLTARIETSGGKVWTETIPVTAATPLLTLSHGVVAASGERTAALPGESPPVLLEVRNEGLRTASGVSVRLSTASGCVLPPTESIHLGDISPSEAVKTVVRLDIPLNCDTPAFPRIDLTLQTASGDAFDDHFSIAVGEEIGFVDDMEAGDGDWTLSGVNGEWHRSPHRVRSGRFSWYAGDAPGYDYPADTERILSVGALDAVTLGPNAVLSFWCWYEFPNYGGDGVYVEVNDGRGWMTLDFIGSGGALGALNTGNDWLPHEYDLARWPAGTVLSVRFRFVGDGDGSVPAEGAYIDDVRIGDGTASELSLAYALMILQTLCDVQCEGYAALDFTGDGRSDLADAVFVLRQVAGM